MKKTRLFIVSFLLFLILSVNVSAFTLPSHTWVEGDITKFGIFKTSMLTSDQKDFMRNWFKSDKTLCAINFNNHYVYFYDFGEHIDFNIKVMNDSIYLQFFSDVNVRYIGFNLGNFEPISSNVMSNKYLANNQYAFNYIVGSTYINYFNKDLSHINKDMFFEYSTSHFAYVDDDGLIEQPEEPDTGIIGWLKDFWEKLKQLFISIFVPEDGYLQQWYNDIKTAFEKKVGGLSSAFSNLSSAFNSLKTSAEERTKIILTLPDNWIFQGYKGASVDLLGYAGGFMSFLRNIFNGIILISTIIICYKNLIKTIKT